MREQPEKIDAKFVKGFIRRRNKIFIIISSLFFAVSILFALFSPRVYVSTATILIEGQIAGELLKGVSMGLVEERLQVITQQILTRDKLIQIHKKLNIHPNLEDSHATDSALEEMRKNIDLKTIRSGDLDPKPYGPVQTTVAFKLSYSSKDASTAYKVAKELSSLYVEKNLERREQITAQTSAVLKEKLSQLKEQANIVEKRLNDFKRAHAGEFPENMSFNLEQTYRLNTQLEEVNAKIKQMEEIKAGSSGQLASRIPAGAATSSDQATNDPLVRLSQLRAQLVSLQSRYSDKHPDVRKTKGEIQRLENQLGVSDEMSRKEDELENLRKRYAELKKNFVTEDPEVKRLSEEISVLSRQIEEQKRNLRRAKSNSAEDEINRQIRKRDEIQRKINEYSRKSQMSSLVQAEYSKLTQEYESASRQYNDTLGKLTDAKVAKEIEDTQLGERFVIIEEPQVPHEPQKPNKLKILLGGLFLALFAGLFASIFVENADHSIKSAEQLQKITKLPILTVLPYVKTDEEKNAEAKRGMIMRIVEDLKNRASNISRKTKTR